MRWTGRRAKIAGAAVALAVVVAAWVRSWDVGDVAWVQRGTGVSVAVGMAEGRAFVMAYARAGGWDARGVSGGHAGSFGIGKSGRYPVVGRQQVEASAAARMGLERVRMRGPWARAGQGGGPVAVYPEMVVGRGWYLPHWAMCVGLVVMVARWGWREAGARRDQRGRVCVRCGYDLRATPIRCPECGEPVAAPS